MKQIFIGLVSILCLISCQNKQEAHYIQGIALGTVYEVFYVGTHDNALPQQIDSLLQVYNHIFSIFDSTSQISKINRNETSRLTAPMEKVLQRSLEISNLSEGAFDITAAPLINAWGFGRDKGLLPTTKKIDSLKQFVGYHNIRISNHQICKDDPRIQLNMNAIVKGYVVDCLADFVRKRHPNFLVNIGGEIVCAGHRPDGKAWNIGIQLPTTDSIAEGEIFHCFSLPPQKAVATSGNYRRYHTDSSGHRLIHIINPKTGYSETSDVLSVTVIAEDCMTADALATAFMVMGRKASLQRLAQHTEWEACFISYEKGKWKVFTTPNFPKATK